MATERRPRIFIGLTETSNMIHEFASALSGAGYAVETLTRPNRYYAGNSYTYCFPNPPILNRWQIVRSMYHWLFSLWFLLRSLPRYDVYVFVWSSRTLLPLHLDLPLLRLLGKRVVVFNCGSDVRYTPLQAQIDRHLLGASTWSLDTLKHRGLLTSLYRHRLQEVSGCRVVSMRNQATFQKRDYAIFHFPARKILEAPKPANPVPLIIHAPSNRVVKGTQHVLDAVNCLKGEGLAFEFELIENADNAYVLSRLIAADILIDQPGTWVGRLSAEGLAAGCVVIGGNNPVYEGIEADSPVVPFVRDSDDLTAKLRDLIQNAEKRQQLMAESYGFWHERYEPSAWVTYFERIVDGDAPTLKPLPDVKALLLRLATPAERRLIRLLF